MGAAEGADGTLSVSGDTPVCVFPPTRGIPLLFVIQVRNSYCCIYIPIHIQNPEEKKSNTLYIYETIENVYNNPSQCYYID